MGLDAETYKRMLSPWLPPVIWDCHVHIGLPEHAGPISPARYKEIWALEVASSFSWTQMRDAYRLLFPDKQVNTLAFGWVYREMDIARNNAYVLDGIRDPANRSKGLAVTKPEWSAADVERLLDDGFVGIKPYPDLSPQCTNEVSVFDFLPHSHLRIVDDRSGVLMLHLPRRGRLADADNIREVLEINDRYPRIKLAVAHIGRAYCLPTAERGLPHFADRPGIYFDTAANLNPDVFAYALEVVGPERILYGSDLPVTLMRGMREHVGERYINYTDGDYSWNTDRKSPEEEAKYTYYLYEELLALKKSIEKAGLGADAVQKIMCGNCARILGQEEC